MPHLWEGGRLGVLRAFSVEGAPWGNGRESGPVFPESTGICAFILLPSVVGEAAPHWLGELLAQKFTRVEGDCAPAACCSAKREGGGRFDGACTWSAQTAQHRAVALGTSGNLEQLLEPVMKC